MSRALTVLAAATALVVVPLAGADANFTDPAGDANGAPDLLGVVVSNDATNRVAFSIKHAAKAVLAADQEVWVWLNSDDNGETGDNGWDHVAWVSNDDYGLDRWDGAKWAEAPVTTARVYQVPGQILFGIDRSELGATASFDLYVEGGKWQGEEQVASDVAPDGDAVWSYATVSKTLALTADAVVPKPKPPVAGKKFTAEFFAERVDSIEPLHAPKLSCVVTVANKRILTRVAGALGFGTCTVARVPLTAKGKLLKVTLTVAAHGKTVSRSYSARVK
jgi:hypothetical protein